MNERCLAILLNKLPTKEKDPGSFTIPYQVSNLRINNALADLGASISLIIYTMYEKLGLGEPKPTRMSLELADRSIQYPRGIVENLLIKVDKLVLPINFVILDMPEDSRSSIILGRPFLATACAMIDVFNKKITLRVGEDEVIFDMDQSNIKTKDKKGAENLVADHLSRLENPHMDVLTKREIADKFPDDHLMVLKSKFNNDEPWYADFVNYIVGKEPYAFKLCADNIMKRCVAGSETLEILAHCHSRPTGGHHNANVIAKKVYESGFYWPSVFKDANEYLNKLAELRDGAYENTIIYKERTKKWHDSRLRGDKYFKVGDKVLLYNSRLKMYPGKLKLKWSGPNIVKMIYPYGAVEIIDRNKFNFKVNGQ
ncbi:reverse transcriptase domain-containing protein [Tanacetum coccineum]